MMLYQSGDALLRNSMPNSLGRDPVPSCQQVGPKVSDCNDRNGLSRKCGNIGPMKRNGYFERFPHRRKDFKAIIEWSLVRIQPVTLGRPLVSPGFAGCHRVPVGPGPNPGLPVAR
jgi:hypothetical protein